jgi:hypothetical protein
MTKRAVWLLAGAGVLLIGYAVVLGGWFGSDPELRIVSQVMTQRPPGPGEPFPIVFSLASPQTLEELRVQRAEPEQAPPAAEPEVLWHVTGQSEEPMRAFVYGRPIDGLEPADPSGQRRGQRLVPGALYRLTLVTDAGRGQLLFRTPAARR